ncbi:DUF2631 domain-containing protein [Geodermatophilus sp. SYSU D00815]
MTTVVQESRHDNPATQRVSQPGREEAVVRAGAHPVEHERPEDWGWHGEMGKWGRRTWWLAPAFILLLLIGNHEGNVENVWLISIAALLVLIFLMDRVRRKNAWRAK